MHYKVGWTKRKTRKKAGLAVEIVAKLHQQAECVSAELCAGILYAFVMSILFIIKS